VRCEVQQAEERHRGTFVGLLGGQTEQRQDCLASSTWRGMAWFQAQAGKMGGDEGIIDDDGTVRRRRATRSRQDRHHFKGEYQGQEGESPLPVSSRSTGLGNDVHVGESI